MFLYCQNLVSTLKPFFFYPSIIVLLCDTSLIAWQHKNSFESLHPSDTFKPACKCLLR